MADPEFLDMSATHSKVLAVLRKYKLSERIIADVSSQFPGHRPTMRARTHTAKRPRARGGKALFTVWGDIPYRQGFAYIGVKGDDGVDAGHYMWLVMTPEVCAEKVRAEIRESVRQHGLRSLNTRLGGVEIFPYPKQGARIDRQIALKHPGVYMETRWACATIKDVHDLVVVHPK